MAPRLTLRFDLRRPDFAPASTAELYAACLDMCEWGDEQGFASLVFSEHHAIADGYIPSPVVMAAAAAGRTKRIGITISALLLPLYNPVKLAEDLAVLDLVSGGRISAVVGMGYRPEEYESLGVDRSQRARLYLEYVDVLRQAWRGEPFQYQGRTVHVTPRPLQQPHPPIFAGGSTPLAARRAARLGLSFFPAVGDPELAVAYREECERLGVTPGVVALSRGPGFVYVARDPDAAWERIAPHAVFEATTYASWQREGQRSMVDAAGVTAEEIRASGVYAVVTPDECVELARELGSLTFHPLMGGLPLDFAWESLQLFASDVLPRLREDA